ncbi:unnamed protein product [Brugia timori]|uniref:Uncharacterized protein n=1 Tax=Brugia timori TaxID=42155 RepID=A0A0R3RDC5_9BILA|nr:unnamed protein product [Brugia timori]
MMRREKDFINSSKVIVAQLTILAKSARSSLNEADEQTSFVDDVDVELDVAVLFCSRGVHVANSHFSKRHDNNGNNG